jgi:hypothetical protein
MILRWVWVVLLCCASTASAQLIAPAEADIVIAEHHYFVTLVSGLTSHSLGSRTGLRLQAAAAETRCAIGNAPGSIRISAALTPTQQAKAMIHEAVHIAQTCDLRYLPMDERIAQDVSDMLTSVEGRFIMKELQ